MAKMREDTWRLSEDLTMEVLIRLPVKTLLQLKVVCKFWYDLIKSPNFIQMHLQYSSTANNRILIASGNNCFVDQSFYVSFHSYESLDLITRLDMATVIPDGSSTFFNICGICNGLVCISDRRDYALLWNPAIRQYKKIHFPPFGFPKRSKYHYCCGGVGFGFDSVTNDYKVVLFVCVGVSRRYYVSDESFQNDESDESFEYDESDESFEEDDEVDGAVVGVGIFNLSTNSWRQINHNLNDIDEDCILLCGPLVSGTLHWMVDRRTPRNNILSFDVNSEEFGHIELPDYPLTQEGRVQDLKLTLVNESLALFVCSYSRDDSVLVDIWVMHEYGMAKSWMKTGSVGPMIGIYHPLLLWKNESIILENCTGKLVSCKLANLDMPEIIGSEIDVGKIIDLMVFYESLVSVA